MEEIEKQLKLQREMDQKKTFKIRLAIFFGYNGKAYKGLQFCPIEGVETVEKQVFQAMVKAGFVLWQHKDNVKEVSWSRGARTDKGVHALCNTAGAKFVLNEADFIKVMTKEQLDYFEAKEKTIREIPDKKKMNQKLQLLNHEKSATKKSNILYGKIKDLLNLHLPEDIRVFTLKPVTNGFNVRHAARSRKYEYYMPLEVFQTWEEFQQKKEFDEEREKQTLEKIEKLFKMYEGTHNFHNFTIKMRPKDPAAIRYMLSMKASIQLTKQSQQKWVRFQLHGASFMYHQIRLMVGMIAKIFQQSLNDDFLSNAFYQNHIAVWLAPAEGLFLNRITFDGYNKKGDVPAPLLIEDDEEKELEDFRMHLVDDIILTNYKVFDEFVNHYNSLTDKQIEEKMSKEKKVDGDDE